MAITNRKDAKDLIQQFSTLFSEVKDTRSILTFGSHEFEVVVTDIRLATQKNVQNVPDARYDGEKKYTPFMLEIVTDAGSLFFVLEGMQIVNVTNGVRIIIGDTTLELRKAT